MCGDEVTMHHRDGRGEKAPTAPPLVPPMTDTWTRPPTRRVRPVCEPSSSASVLRRTAGIDTLWESAKRKGRGHMDTKIASRVWWAIALSGALAVIFGLVCLFYTN